MSIASMINRVAHIVTFERAVKIDSGHGTVKRVWFPEHENIKGWLQPASSSVIELYAKLSLVVTHRFYTAQELDIKQNDRMKFGSRTMLVQGFKNVAEMGRLWVIDVLERD